MPASTPFSPSRRAGLVPSTPRVTASPSARAAACWCWRAWNRRWRAAPALWWDCGGGEALAISRALQDAQLPAGQVDYINTHGTATRHNDNSEMQAISHAFGADAPRILANSIKPLIGHCMGAAGIMEAICTVLTLQKQTVTPTAFTDANESALVF